MPLFPVVEPIQGRIILVEGIFDVMNLHDKGLTNAVCCFGVKNVTEEKLQVLAVSGVEGVDIFLDNDEAGQGQAVKVRELCESVGLQYSQHCFWRQKHGCGCISSNSSRQTEEINYMPKVALVETKPSKTNFKKSSMDWTLTSFSCALIQISKKYSSETAILI